MLPRLVLNNCSSHIQFLSAGVTAMGHHDYLMGLTTDTAIPIRAQLIFFSHQKHFLLHTAYQIRIPREVQWKQPARGKALLGLTGYQTKASKQVFRAM